MPDAMHAADKRPAVEIALREFPKLSSRAIAELCGVSYALVQDAKPQVTDSVTSTVTGADGKQYPARHQTPTNAPAANAPAKRVAPNRRHGPIARRTDPSTPPPDRRTMARD